jgi:hypothetical protein
MAKRPVQSASKELRQETRELRQQSTASVKALEKTVVAIAEQLGRIAGTAQARTDSWMNQPNFTKQLVTIRDRAAKLLDRVASLTSAKGNGAAKVKRARPRSGGKVDAPGKKHRKAPVAARGVKHSDQKISKALTAERMKRGRARQG